MFKKVIAMFSLVCILCVTNVMAFHGHHNRKAAIVEARSGKVLLLPRLRVRNLRGVCGLRGCN